MTLSSLKDFYDISLNIFILHRLRNKFLQLILISLDSASWELHQYSRRMCGPMKNPKVEIRSRDSNSGPHDCKVDALPYDHGHHFYDIDQIICFSSTYLAVNQKVSTFFFSNTDSRFSIADFP